MTLETLKTELRGILPRGFLRRARSDEWLLISDFPRFSDIDVKAPLTAKGWRMKREGDTLLLDPTPERYAALIASLPPVKGITLTEAGLPRYGIVQWLSQKRTPPKLQPVAPVRLTLKYLGTREEQRLWALLPPMFAALLREGKPLPTGVAALLTNEKEATVC